MLRGSAGEARIAFRARSAAAADGSGDGVPAAGRWTVGSDPAKLVAAMQIRRDDLEGPEIKALLAEHLRNMHAISPRESVHALPVELLRAPDITFWTVWSGAELLGCGALRELSATHGEIKSMRTAMAHRRKGVGRAMLLHILGEATAREYRRLSLETGAQAEFEPARRLYAGFGFVVCGPFGDYTNDPNSVFMTKRLDVSSVG
jgi:putative acetyltransferase